MQTHGVGQERSSGVRVEVGKVPQPVVVEAMLLCF